MISRIAICLLGFLSACSSVSHVKQLPEQTAATDMSVVELAAAIRAGDITAEASVAAYLARIAAYDRQGPMIQSILSLNPKALDEARILDEEASANRFRGVLHGVPVLIKDNIETRELPTTAGSLALIQNNTGRDAPIIARLREQGAIILGKTNLSEWANFRSNRAIAGWSGVGGQTRNPHSLDRSPCGSSAGSAAAVAAMFAPLAIGTETNGSITCPASMNGVIGFKPTVGLLSRTHIVPISYTQDSAGPITRTVRDAALLLTVMAGSDPADPATVQADQKRHNYLDALNKGVAGMRIGVFRWAEGNNAAVSSAFSQALSILAAEGATLVEIAEFSPAPVMWSGGELLLQTEFKHMLNDYLGNTAAEVNVRTLDDLIAFNDRHADRELALFDQSILVASQQAKQIDDPDHVATVQAIRQASRADGIDHLLSEYDVAVLVMPTSPPASPIDVAFTTRYAGAPLGAGWLSAMAGYPIITVPMGEHLGLPLGLAIMGTAWDDDTVLAVAHAYESAADNQLQPPPFADGPFAMPATAADMRPYQGQ